MPSYWSQPRRCVVFIKASNKMAINECQGKLRKIRKINQQVPDTTFRRLFVILITLQVQLQCDYLFLLIKIKKDIQICTQYFSRNSDGVNISGRSISTSEKSLSPVINISTSSIIAVAKIG